MVSLESISPSSQISSIVERYFITTGELPAGQLWENRLLPSIMQSIIIDFNSTPPRAKFSGRPVIVCDGDLIMGQYTRSCISILEGKIDFIGIQFSPTGIHQLLGADMAQFSNNILPLKSHITWHAPLRQQLAKSVSVADRIAVIEQFLIANLKPSTHYLNKIVQAAALIRNSKGKISMLDLCKITGMSERSLQRYFKFCVGVTPKAFAQISRFNTVTKMIDDQVTPSWQEIQDETGYFDAAHFVNDFKRITGKTPSAYYKGKTHYEKFFNAS